MNKANSSDTKAPFLNYIYLFLMVLFLLKFMIKAMTLGAHAQDCGAFC